MALLDKVTRALEALLTAHHLCRAERITHFEKLCCVIFKTENPRTFWNKVGM